jgi:subtilisin family serine protease
MTAPDERLEEWRRRREVRLSAHPRLLSTATGGSARAWYVRDEVLVAEGFHAATETVLRGRGYAPNSRTGDGYEEIGHGLRRYRAAGLDVASVIAQVHATTPRPVGRDGRTRRVVGRNHVFLSTPFYHGGPAGPPLPTAPGGLKPGSGSGPDTAAVAVIDTGIWLDSPLLPDEHYIADPGDFEVAVDVDKDGILDGDVGHANFIAGVILGRTREARVRIIKVLDTLGVCTEAQLVQALARVDDDVDVINLSLGGFSLANEAPVALRAALDAALAGRDRVVVAAAGNDSNDQDPFWPAAFASQDEEWSGQVVAVAAHDGQRLCEFSNSGKFVTISAPGQDLVSTFVNADPFDTGWAVWSGTSFATPYVVAAIAERMTVERSARAAWASVLASAQRQLIDGRPSLP